MDSPVKDLRSVYGRRPAPKVCVDVILQLANVSSRNFSMLLRKELRLQVKAFTIITTTWVG